MSNAEDIQKISYKEYQNYTVQCEILMPGLVDTDITVSHRINDIDELLKQNDKFLAAAAQGRLEIPANNSSQNVIKILQKYATDLNDIREAIDHRPSYKYK